MINISGKRAECCSRDEWSDRQGRANIRVITFFLIVVNFNMRHMYLLLLLLMLFKRIFFLLLLSLPLILFLLLSSFLLFCVILIYLLLLFLCVTLIFLLLLFEFFGVLLLIFLLFNIIIWPGVIYKCYCFNHIFFSVWRGLSKQNTMTSQR